MFSCEFSKISKNTFFTEYLRTTASVFSFSEAATRGALWKKVFLKISQNSQQNTFGLRNTFFTECLGTGRLPLLLAFEKQPLELFYEKRCSWKSRKIYRKTDTFGLQNFQKHLFYRTPLDDCFWLFRATLLKWGTANSVWKTSDEYSLSRNTNLRSTVQVYHFFFGRINFQCMSSLVYTVYCEKQPSE